MSDDSKCQNHPHHPPTLICRYLYFGLKNQYKIVLFKFYCIIVLYCIKFKYSKKIFLIVYDANRNIKKLK